MDRAVVQQAITFVNSYYGLEEAISAAQVDARLSSGWMVTVWIGAYLKQRVIVTPDGTVQRNSVADSNTSGELAC